MRPCPEAGFALIEVLVSALVATLLAGAALTLLGASAHQASDQRQRSAAYAVAQEDQARLRSLRVPTLNRLSQTRTVTVGGTDFTVASTGQFVNDTTGTASCGQGSSSADYVKATSSVTWPGMGGRPPVVIQSIIAPPTGSLDPNHGTLTIAATNAQGAPISGIGVSGSGAGTFSGSTDSAGCAVFADQNAGNYTLSPSGGAGLIDKDGNAPSPQTISVISGTTNTVALQYDQGGSIPVTFKTRIGSSPTLVNSTADSVVVFNTGMTSAKSYGSPGGARLTTVTATPLFPFTSPDTVYAGSCTGNNPNPNSLPNPPGAAAMASVTVPSGGSAPAQVQLPALNLTVFSGTGPTIPGSAVSNAHVIVNDTTCAVKRTYFTNTSGKLADPGLPWSSNSGYTVCVDNGSRRKTTSGVLVQDLANGTTLNVYMGTGTSSGVCT
jgi:Tfp pilus assembly protein PilV